MTDPHPTPLHRVFSSLTIVMQPRTRTAFFLALGIVISGCGSSGKTAAVTGRITYKDKPVAKASVSFTPAEGATPAANGITDEDGGFTLSTFGINDGALPGNYRVAVIARGPDRPPRPGEMGSGMPGEMMPGEAIIPTKYFARDSSGLTYEVKPGKNQADFDLKN
jgi:hypothetical protein